MDEAEQRDNPILDSIKDTELDLSIVLREKTCQIRDLLSLNPGSVLMFGAPTANTGYVTVNGRTLAQGEVVQVSECYALRITDVVKQ